MFVEPGTLDITREKSPHLAFGKGLHYCLGAPLARLEGKLPFGFCSRNTQILLFQLNCLN
ncbi:hypothetical protein AAAC51_41300 [Priestia megaterium]